MLVTGTVVTGTGPHGGDDDVERLPFDITDVARVHSLCTWVFLALTVLTLVELRRSGTRRSGSTAGRQLLVGAIVVQGAIGYTQYFTGVPPWLVGLHVAGQHARLDRRSCRSTWPSPRVPSRPARQP